MKARNKVASVVACLGLVLVVAVAWSQNAVEPGGQQTPLSPGRSAAPFQNLTLRIWLVEASDLVDALALSETGQPVSFEGSPETLLAKLKRDDAIDRVERYTLSCVTDAGPSVMSTGAQAWGRNSMVRTDVSQQGTRLECTASSVPDDQILMTLAFNHTRTPPKDASDQDVLLMIDLNSQWLHRDGRTTVIASRDAGGASWTQGQHWYLLVQTNATP